MDFASSALGLSHLTFGCGPKSQIAWLGIVYNYSGPLLAGAKLEITKDGIMLSWHTHPHQYWQSEPIETKRISHQMGFPISMPFQMHCRKYSHPQYIQINLRFWGQQMHFQHPCISQKRSEDLNAKQLINTIILKNVGQTINRQPHAHLISKWAATPGLLRLCLEEPKMCGIIQPLYLPACSQWML